MNDWLFALILSIPAWVFAIFTIGLVCFDNWVTGVKEEKDGK